jgi:Tfp pilus assembly protein PilO
MKKNAKLTVLLIICVALLLGLGTLKLLYPKYTDMSKKADANEKVAEEANAKLDLAKGLNPKSINTRLSKLKARVPNSLELPNVILRINQKANESSLLWLEGTPEDVTAITNAAATTTDATSAVAPIAPQLNIHQVTIKVRGDVNNLVKFYAMLSDKSIGRIVVVTGTKITPVTAENQVATNQIDAEITLNIYGWIDGSNIDISGCEKDTSVSDPDCSVAPS